MNTLKDYVIIYDDECPMCDTYTDAFVKTGMLDEGGRVAYSQAETSITENINTERACNEIALFNKNTGDVSYGVDSLIIVIENSFKFSKPLFRIIILKWLLRKLYALISFNRKVIVPAKKIKGACVPSFNLKYRLVYIVFTWIVSSLVLNAYSAMLVPIVPPSNFYREFAICGGQILFQSIVLMIIRRDKVFEYVGNMMTVSFAGSLALIPLLLLKNFIHQPYIYLLWFMLVVTAMFFEHIRRVKLIEVPWVASLSWVVYRIIVLSLIYPS